MSDDHIRLFLEGVRTVAQKLSEDAIKTVVHELASLRQRGGRLFVLGIGGGAANASHAVNDLRKLCFIEAYAPTDNVSEFSARANDEGFDSTFQPWLATSRLGDGDAVLVFSVGGGSRDAWVSVNIAKAVEYARSAGARVLGIVGRDTGATARMGHAVVVVPFHTERWITPMSEAFQMVILHAIVSHPLLQRVKTKW